MSRRLSRYLAAGGSLALSLGGCNTTYTAADLSEAERKQDAEARREEQRDQEVQSEEGGANAEQIHQEERQVDRDSDL